jgi:hypothetical protein
MNNMQHFTVEEKARRSHHLACSFSRCAHPVWDAKTLTMSRAVARSTADRPILDHNPPSACDRGRNPFV